MDWSGSGGSGGEFGMADNLNDPNEILVFGYACKLFRDDDKARWIDSERHLIPWMGDAAVKIDRYDGRGALMDFTTGGGLEGNIAPLEGGGLPDGPQLERLLEEERYRDLREDLEFDDGNYQEVEFRKFQFDVNSAGRGESGEDNSNSYAAVGYCYDQPVVTGVKTVEEAPTVEKTDDDKPFVKPRGLMLPPNFTVPTTMKLHSIIEKTAKFIASHGNQMEIILKTKQSGNPLFNFLDYKDTLNPYFKFLVAAIRENSYTPSQEPPEASPAAEPSNTADREGSSDDDDDDDDGYLHPSLFRSSMTDPSTTILPPSLNFKANTENSAYSLLVSKIRGSSNSGTSSPIPPVINANPDYDTYNGSYEDYSSYGTAYPHSESYPTTMFNSSYSYDPNVPFSRPDSQLPNSSDQLVIEKMASYVVKNGAAFEELARTKGDTRFVFLNPSHEYHWYYLNCKERFKAESAAVVVNRQFVSYTSDGGSNSPVPTSTNATETEPVAPPKRIILKSVELPLSASGIPIANLESICSRPTSIPPEVASRIEMIKKKHSLFAKKEKELSPPKIQFSSAIGKSLTLGADEIDPATTTQDPEGLWGQSETILNTTVAVTSPDVEIIAQFPTSTSFCNNEPVPEQSKAEAELLRKQIRRQKAALFLQKISAKSSNASDDTTATDNNNDIVLIDPTKTEIKTPKDSTENKNGTESNTGHERLHSQSPTPIEGKNGTYSRRRSRSISRSRSRSRSYRRSQSRSSESSFLSTMSESNRKKKRSHRKSSKKVRKKKHERGRSRSSSRSRKKSKKHKR